MAYCPSCLPIVLYGISPWFEKVYTASRTYQLLLSALITPDVGWPGVIYLVSSERVNFCPAYCDFGFFLFFTSILKTLMETIFSSWLLFLLVMDGWRQDTTLFTHAGDNHRMELVNWRSFLFIAVLFMQCVLFWINPNSLSIVTEQYKSFKIIQLPLLSRESGLMAEKSLQMDTLCLPSLALPTQLHLSMPYFWAVGISVPILYGPFLSDEQIPTSAHQTYHYDRNQLLNIQNDSTDLSIPVSTWNILNNLKINSKPITRRGSRGGIRKFKNNPTCPTMISPNESPTQHNDATVCLWNARSIRNKTTALNDCLIIHDVDVMCIWVLAEC